MICEMSWSKVKKGKKPLLWWYHKIVCEIGYHLFGSTSKMYMINLRKMCDMGYNLYGEKMSKRNFLKG